MVILSSNISNSNNAIEFRKKNKHESLKISKKFKHRKNRRSSLIARRRWHEKRYVSRRDRLDLKHHTQELMTEHINDDNQIINNMNKKNRNSNASSIYKARGGGGPKQKPKSKKLISICKSESRNQLLKEIKNLDSDLSLRYCSKVSKIIKQCKNKETGKAFLKKLQKKQISEQSQKCVFFIKNLFLFDELNNKHKKRKRKKRKSGNNNKSSKENKKEDENSSDYWRYYNRSRKIESNTRVSKFYRLFFLLTSLSMDSYSCSYSGVSASRYTVYQMLEAQLDSLMKINNKTNYKNKNKNRNNKNNCNDNDNNNNDIEFSDEEKAEFIELVLYQVFGEINSDFISQVLSYWKEQQQYKKEEKQKYWGWGKKMKNKTTEQTSKMHDTRKQDVSASNDTEIHFDNNTMSTTELKLRYSVLLTSRNNINDNNSNSGSNNSVGSTITIDEIGCKVIETSCDCNTVIATKSYNDVNNSVCKLEININEKEKLIGEAVLNLMNINKTNKHGIKLVDNMNNIDSVNVELLNRGWMMNTNTNTNGDKFNYVNMHDGQGRWKERICIERIYGLCSQMWYLLLNKYYCHDVSGVLIPRFTFKPSVFGFNKTKLGEISDILYNLKITNDEDSINSNNNYIPFDVVSLIIIYVGYNKYERIEFDAILDGSHNNNNVSLTINNCQGIKSIRLTPENIDNLFASDNIELIKTVTTSNIFRYDCDGNNTAGVINKNIFLDDEVNVVDWEKDYLATKKVDDYDTDDTSYLSSYGVLFGDDSSSYWSSSSD